MKLLNIGCGPIYLESNNLVECENSDFADSESAQGWRLDKKRDFMQPMTDIQDGSIDFIVAWHIVEHMPMHQISDVLREWYRVLKPGGKVFIATPDLTKIARHIVDRDGPWADWFICMVNVFGPYNGFIGDIHRWMYDYNEMRKKLSEVGFGDYQELTPDSLMRSIGINNGKKLGFADYNLQVEAKKL